MNLPGWFCGYCGIFNGEAKIKHLECRTCDEPRMSDRTREFKLSLLVRGLCVTCGNAKSIPGIQRCAKCKQTNHKTSKRWRAENA